jgi:NSS family neurotransmitter:Na+ symporter
MAGNELKSVKRESWSGRYGAIMSMAAMAVGLGNVWRFPYMLGANGGGAFLVAYMIILLIVGIPLAIVEAGFGKGIGKGTIDAFGAALHNKKAGVVVGGAAALIYFSMNFFFLAIIGVSLYFMYVCVVQLWGTVPPDQLYTQLMANKALILILFLIITGVVSAIVYRGINKGIEKVSKIMVPGMLLGFIILIVYAFRLPGIGAGYEFLLAPKWEVLGEPGIWKSAMGQVLFSLGVGPGCILVYGSHLKKTADVTTSIVTTTLLDSTVALIAALAIIPACIALGLNPEGGSSLIFVVIPTFLSSVPGGAIIGFFVFLAIFFAAVTSAVAQLEVPVTTFSDAFNWNRKKVVVVFTVITLIASIPAIFNNELLDFWNMFAGNYGFILFAIIGGILFSWVYGVKKIRLNFLNPTSDIKLGRWFDYLVTFVAVPVMLFIMVTSLIG